MHLFKHFCREITNPKTKRGKEIAKAKERIKQIVCQGAEGISETLFKTIKIALYLTLLFSFCFLVCDRCRKFSQLSEVFSFKPFNQIILQAILFPLQITII